LLTFNKKPTVVEVEIRGYDIVDKLTGKTLIYKTNSATWRSISGNAKDTISSQDNRKGKTYLVSWDGDYQSIPEKTEIGPVIVWRSNHTHVFNEANEEAGICYDLSYHNNRLKLVHVTEEEDVRF
jgi:hypothetical protein